VVVVDLALAGLGIGAIAALAGLGLLVTHRATGVFNVAFGAIATLAAYLLWQFVERWDWPLVPALVLVVGVLCPLLGVALDVGVFRPLQRRRASAGESLVATIGIFVLLVGVCTFTWGIQARTDAPSLAPSRSVEVLGATVRMSTIVDVGVMVLVGLGIALVLRTRLGLLARAVVDDRDLAELSVVDVDRVSTIAWAAGAAITGLSGVLLAPALRLDPYTLTLVVLETMAVVVFARLRSPVVVIASGLAIGVVQSELTRVHLDGRAGVLFDAFRTNIFVVALLGALLLLRRLDEPGGNDAGAVTSLATRGMLPTPRGWWVPAALFLGIPLFFSRGDMQTAHQVPAFAIILVSIVVVSGYSGQISLGQAGYAGLGALLTAKFTEGQVFGIPEMPGVVGLLVAVLVTGVIASLVAWPAIRRRGLFLALTTFAVAAVLSRFVFAQPTFVSGTRIAPPAPFDGPTAFYVFELACLGLGLLVVRIHHQGRLGRALLAVRDDEAGARACGVDADALRIWVFAVGASLAALGGGLLAQSAHAFDGSAFDPLRGLVWFAAVVVFGIDSAAGAVLGAALIVGLDESFAAGFSTVVIGAAAVVLGRMPGGALFTVRSVVAALLRRLERPSRPGNVRLSPAGRALAARLHR
jgi:branched-chain amino acid transport system permease protein